MKGKILVQSSNVDTYVNIIAAMYAAYQDLREVRMSFVDSAVDEIFIDAIQAKLSSSEDNIYKKAARLNLSGESIQSNDKKHGQGWDIIDVSAVSKEISLNMVAATIDNRKINICTLQWKVKFNAKERWNLTQDNHDYSNLLSKGALSELYKNYFQRNQVIYVFGVIFIILCVFSLIKLAYPSFIVPAEIVNFFSMLVSLAGLYLAAISIKY